ncbi:SDR family NAD(P)-dependent oxidoreductase [Candidatus Poseidoniaceae archaeon]|nr:SDR family NAD(P)-dependent oxidoreductase [Candidatus Poseidoniaceae archaeon]
MGQDENTPDMHILITGGAGFIGSNLAEHLIQNGIRATVLDNLLTGKVENISHLMGNELFSFIEGDIRDFQTCKNAVAGCTHISHQAALGSVPRSIDDPITSLEINISGTVNVFRAAVEEGVKRIVFASSSSVYGTDQTLPKTESKVGEVLSPYAASKRSMELIQQAFVECYEIEILGFRYFNVFGKRQDPEGPYAAVIPKFIMSLAKGETPSIFGDGEQSRDFTHISNVVTGNMAALLKPSLGKLNGKVINLAYGGMTTVNELFYEIRKNVGLQHPDALKIEPSYQAKRLGDILHSHANIDIAKSELGFVPGIAIDEGLQRTVEWYLRHMKD